MNLKALSLLMVPLIGIGGVALWHYSEARPEAQSEVRLEPATPPVSLVAAPVLRARASTVGLKSESVFEPGAEIELPAAISQRLVAARWTGNGREKMQLNLRNLSDKPLTVAVGYGLALDSGKNSVMLAHPALIELVPMGSATCSLDTLALRSSNKLLEAPYELSDYQSGPLQGVLSFAQEHRELSPPVLQTMALALTENLPLSAVAKFTPVTGELLSRFNTDVFRVDPVDIIAALGALRQMGIEETAIAMTIDPQLKIEAMIDPLSRAAAMSYYGITSETEWEFWKSELLSGAPATRHYALYGIARFYPDIALDMLPKWAREPRTNVVYRLSALQALADTRRAEALPILLQLSTELGPQTELGRAARGAAQYLEKRLSSGNGRSDSIAFREAKDFTKF